VKLATSEDLNEHPTIASLDFTVIAGHDTAEWIDSPDPIEGQAHKHQTLQRRHKLYTHSHAHVRNPNHNSYQHHHHHQAEQQDDQPIWDPSYVSDVVEFPYVRIVTLSLEACLARVTMEEQTIAFIAHVFLSWC
jgi:hypothetical protein